MDKDKIILNLNNPIFAHYVSVYGLTRPRAAEIIEQYSRAVNIYSNITNWVIAIDGESRIECVYDGFSKKKDIYEFINMINTFMESLSDSISVFEFKQKIRDLKISIMLDEKL